MGRLREGERERRATTIVYLIRRARGLTEAEIAEELRCNRRTINNYLRALVARDKITKTGIYYI